MCKGYGECAFVRGMVSVCMRKGYGECAASASTLY